MKSKGKNFDVRVILEPDEIPPNNIESYLLLENAGIPVRWALLDGTGLTHNRKLHSKMMVSDKIILTGSTNLTHKGLRESWETSVLSFIDKGSEESISKREEYKKSFLDLWDKETLKLDLSYKNDTYPAVMSKEEYQRDLLKKTVRNIDRYERVFDGKVKDILDSREDVKEEVEKLKKDGLHEGNARLIALKKFYTEEEMKSLRISTGII
jgi:phosphatidylserine/phosphatidylglycerophosphate/cardiolipin synthase-like enzyme